MNHCLQCGRDCQGDDLFCSPVCEAGSAPAAEWHRLNDRVAELECRVASPVTDDTELDLTVQVPRRVSRRMVLVDREELDRLRARVGELESEVAGLQGGYDDLAARHESLLNQLGATDA